MGKNCLLSPVQSIDSRGVVIVPRSVADKYYPTSRAAVPPLHVLAFDFLRNAFFLSLHSGVDVYLYYGIRYWSRYQGL